MNFSKKNAATAATATNNNNSPGCFSSIFGRFKCAGYLPTYPTPPEEIPDKNPNTTKINAVPNNNCSDDDRAVVVRTEVQGEGNPGIVARLMGLDSLPNPKTTTKPPSSINDSLSRSKSLNSLHFLPDFNPTKPSYHRRVRTSLSTPFHEQRCSLLVTINENLETNGEKTKHILKGSRDESKQQKEKVEKAVVSSGNERTKTRKSIENNKNYNQERYYKGKCNTCRTKSNKNVKDKSVRDNVVGSNNNSPREKCGSQKSKLFNKDNDKYTKIGSKVSRKNEVVHRYEDYCGEVEGDVLSRSPISVLDHGHEFDSSSREDTDATTPQPKLRRRSRPKVDIVHDIPQTPPPQQQQQIDQKSTKKCDDFPKKIACKNKVVNEDNDANVAEYFEDLSLQIYALGEDQLCKDLSSHVKKYDLFKGHFVDELCLGFGQDMLDFLLDELISELGQFSLG
ncbi:hypothetical protein vseg_020499 [Gypsophila vaccaria]